MRHSGANTIYCENIYVYRLIRFTGFHLIKFLFEEARKDTLITQFFFNLFIPLYPTVFYCKYEDLQYFS